MTATANPTTDLDVRYGEPTAAAMAWEDARSLLAAAELYWLTTVRLDGRPHVTPLIAVWVDGALHVTTGPEEQKAQNLARNGRCAVTKGCNRLREGTDLVIEGDAERVTGRPGLERIADAYLTKYGPDWRFEISEEGDGFVHHGGASEVYAIVPSVGFGFGKAPYAQTRWRFTR